MNPHQSKTGRSNGQNSKDLVVLYHLDLHCEASLDAPLDEPLTQASWSVEATLQSQLAVVIVPQERKRCLGKEHSRHYEVGQHSHQSQETRADTHDRTCRPARRL